MWQALYEELKDRGFIVITVALDKSAEDARPWIEAARPTHPSLIDTRHVVAELARVVDRPLAIDAGERAAYLGVSAGARARALHSLVAPDFTLPDLAGRPHRLSDHRGKKILLVAYASW